MKTKLLKLDEIIPYKKNNKIHTDEQLTVIRKSIADFWYVQKICVDKNNEIIIWHWRLEAIKQLNKTWSRWDSIEVNVLDNLSDNEIKKLRLIDNKSNEMAEWDFENIKFELDELDDMELNEVFGDMEWLEDYGEETEDDKYTKKVESPVYIPKEEMPEMDQLFDNAKTKELLVDIEKSNVSADIKEFLTMAAHRQTVFNFDKVAEYYSHLWKEEQELFEDNALVIIDYNKAIEKWYVKLTEDMIQLQLDSKDIIDQE